VLTALGAIAPAPGGLPGSPITPSSTASAIGNSRGLIPIGPSLSVGAYAAPRAPSILVPRYVTGPDRTGMICHVSDSEVSREARAITPPRDPKIRWWSRISPWLWGLLILAAVAAVAATQLPRIEAISAASRPRPSSTAASATPSLVGPVYTQAMVTGRSFARADLRGAILAHLDLRGKDFQGADAAGAVFAGSLLDGVNLSHVNLRGANLAGACLRGAILTKAELAGADFTGADVTGATITPATTSSAIGWASIPASSVCKPG